LRASVGCASRRIGDLWIATESFPAKAQRRKERSPAAEGFPFASLQGRLTNLNEDSSLVVNSPFALPRRRPNNQEVPLRNKPQVTLAFMLLGMIE
jgi:hypothetical protein